MPAANRAIELRPRAKENVSDPNGTTYKVYTYGRLRGAIMPIPEDEEGNRWTALDLTGTTTNFRYRNQARDHLVNQP
ncbi:MAG: hypothetical protein IT303_19160 [Dehalococcoidia bacterium]|nr:hypothetical protein [Dehalococcoidia bacterium]